MAVDAADRLSERIRKFSVHSGSVCGAPGLADGAGGLEDHVRRVDLSLTEPVFLADRVYRIARTKTQTQGDITQE